MIIPFWERRAPLTPAAVSKLISEGTRCLIQPSPRRIFHDSEYRQVGAEITDDLSSASLILGVKEFPHQSLIPNKSYLIFSHVIKAQPYNMPFLDACLEKNIRLYDYETIRTAPSSGDTSKRLVAFGQFAGLAGMMDGMRGVGERLLSLGYTSPFMSIASAYMYPNLAEAKNAVERVGNEIKRVGIPTPYAPFRFVFTGSGNVSDGARKIFELLPHTYVSPSELLSLPRDPHRVYGSVVTAKDMVAHRKGAAFNKSDYYNHPTEYYPTFHSSIAPNTTVLINGLYWDVRYPRLLTNNQLSQLQKENKAPLAIIDISCDIGGSIESLVKSTSIESPYFMWDRGSIRDLIEGSGTLMMGIDNLPAEFPREASEYFSHSLLPYVTSIASAPIDTAFNQLQTVLPIEMYNSCITADGKLTPNFEYISRLRSTHKTTQSAATLAASSNMTITKSSSIGSVKDTPSLPNVLITTSFLLEGHLFDTNFINQALDLFEHYCTDFQIILWDVTPNRGLRKESVSKCVIKVVVEESKMNELRTSLDALVIAMPKANGKINRLESNEGYSQLSSHSDISSPVSTPSIDSNALVSESRSSLEQMSSNRKKILILGSGFVASPVVKWLCKNNYEVTVASNILVDAEKLVVDTNGKAQAIELDVTNSNKLTSLISSSNIVISLLPSSMHLPVAQTCLTTNTHLITASYTSPSMHSLHSEAEKRNLIFLNEVGLDPGLDHMSAMSVINQIKSSNGRIVGFQSLCGGLPAPEAANNPFGYKFSWSPLGMLTASQNPARYLDKGKLIQIEGKNLLSTAKPYKVNPAFNFEEYPNRDALIYGKLYGLDDNLQSLYRGTIRYQGTSSLLYACSLLGLMERKINQIHSNNWREFLAELIQCNIDNVESGIMDKLTSSKISMEESRRTIDALLWLGALSPTTPLSQSTLINSSTLKSSPIDLFCSLLQSKLTFQPSERDMILLSDTISYYPSNHTTSLHQHTSTLLVYGDTASSAMAKTVGLPAAMAAHLILENGVIRNKGVLIPTVAELYEPILSMLEKEGISFVKEEKIQR